MDFEWVRASSHSSDHFQADIQPGAAASAAARAGPESGVLLMQ